MGSEMCIRDSTVTLILTLTVFASTPIPSLAKVPIRHCRPIRSLELSCLCCLSYHFFTARPHCLQYGHAVLSALVELLVWHRQGLVQSIVSPIHAITHHPPKTDPLCSAISPRQQSYLIVLYTVVFPVFTPVPDATGWWQSHKTLNNLPNVVTQQCQMDSRTLNLSIATTPYRRVTIL